MTSTFCTSTAESTVVKYVPNNCQRHFTLTNLVSMPQNLNFVKKKKK